MVYSIAMNLFHNAATAEEVAHDVFLELVREPVICDHSLSHYATNAALCAPRAIRFRFPRDRFNRRDKQAPCRSDTDNRGRCTGALISPRSLHTSPSTDANPFLGSSASHARPSSGPANLPPSAVRETW